MSKDLLHLLLVRRALGAPDEALDLRHLAVGCRLVNVAVARRVLLGPGLELVPAAAHAVLVQAGHGDHVVGGEARRVVGVADGLLAHLVYAVQHVAPAARLRLARLELVQGNVDGALFGFVSSQYW